MMTEEQTQKAFASKHLVSMLSECDLYLLTMDVDEWENQQINDLAHKIYEAYVLARNLTIKRAGYEVGESVEPV